MTALSWFLFGAFVGRCLPTIWHFVDWLVHAGNSTYLPDTHERRRMTNEDDYRRVR